MIHACHLVKGKPKGTLRVVQGRASCRRVERKVAWVVTGAVGLPGLNGSQGPLAGVTNGDLVTLVNSLPVIESVCEQSEALTKQVTLLAEVVKGLGLNGALKTLGGLLEIPALPEPLEAFSCPSF